MVSRGMTGCDVSPQEGWAAMGNRQKQEIRGRLPGNQVRVTWTKVSAVSLARRAWILDLF